MRLWRVPYRLVEPTETDTTCLVADDGRVVVSVDAPHFRLDGAAVSFEDAWAAVRDAGKLYLTADMVRRFAL